MISPSLHDLSFNMEHATRESREATFAPPTKRSKSGWPHKTPTAADLARAGFYYKPSSHSNDNTVCFLCDRNLDGWEENDDPVQEHLKHAEDCAWAQLMAIEAVGNHDTSNMEDPTGQQLSDARKKTFSIGWPHDGKRGWTCKTDKMVEAGWYFAPSQGSEDYVSCAYCKLSLDGWEPKDDPFEEHYSRSSGCPFFVFAGTTAASKRPKAKKPRASRASRTSKASTRLSTQSNNTVQSEVPSIPDLDESIDNSAVSLMSTVSTASNKGKRKATTGRAKTTKSKRAKTTKTKKAEESESLISESVVEKISYPQLHGQDEQESQESQTQQEPIQPESMEEKVLDVNDQEAEMGPPDMPSEVIPALPESPTPESSRKPRPTKSPAMKIIPQAPKAATPVPQLSPTQESDLENAPPSIRPESVRPPVPTPGRVFPSWDAVDVEMIFQNMQGLEGLDMAKEDMLESEKQMTVQDWFTHMARKAENELRAEGERVVGVFEKEGQRALTLLEAVPCI